jgi:hypothetical protein
MELGFLPGASGPAGRVSRVPRGSGSRAVQSGSFPARINQKWYGDGTEIGTGEGKLHLDSVLDMGSRRVLGFALGEHHDVQLAYGALAMAVAVRGGPVPGVILHTDQGSDYDTARRHSALGMRSPADPGAAGSAGILGRPPAARAFWASASRWAGPGRRWTTRGSRPGTRPWSSSCGASRTSPPGRRAPSRSLQRR